MSNEKNTVVASLASQLGYSRVHVNILQISPESDPSRSKDRYLSVEAFAVNADIGDGSAFVDVLTGVRQQVRGESALAVASVGAECVHTLSSDAKPCRTEQMESGFFCLCLFLFLSLSKP